MFCNVIIIRPFDQVFTYKLKKGQLVSKGSIVSVPFGKSNNEIGMVESVIKNAPINNYKIKEVEEVFDLINFNENIINFIFWIRDYTLAPIGSVLKLFLINEKIINFSINKKKENSLLINSVVLNTDQKNALNEINKFLFKPTLPIVLEGVTGSGKTEVFF